MSLLSIDMSQTKRIFTEAPPLEAKDIIEGENSYHKEEIVARIIENTNGSPAEAERLFNIMIRTGAIEKAGIWFFLGGSTPF